jgi:hypothetical protein
MKLKSLILSFALTLFAVSGVVGQDKYELAKVYSIQQHAKSGKVFVVKSKGAEEIEYEGSRADIPLLTQVEKMISDGWELFTITNEYGASHYHLRKKKN